MQVFSSLADTLPLPALRDYEARIDEVCWLVCKRIYTPRDLLAENCLLPLFRVFCMLGQLTHLGGDIYQVEYALIQNIALHYLIYILF